MKRILLIVTLMTVSLGISAQEALYTVKSGKITMEAGMGGMGRGGMRAGGERPGGRERGMRGEGEAPAMTTVIYFDDYGAKQVTVTEFDGRSTRTLVVDGKNIMVNDTDRTAMEMPSMGLQSGRSAINFSNLTEKVIRKNRIKEAGEEEVAGKLCKKYTYNVMMMGRAIKQTVWIYKGITLKSSMNTDFGEIGQNALSIEEDIEVDPALFLIPEGVEIQKIQMPQMGGMGGMGGMDDGFGF